MRIVFGIILLLLAGNGWGQNLVPNASFEEKVYCPTTFNQQSLTIIKSWKQPTSATPDYFNSCSRDVGVPGNIFGSQPASDGEAFAGLVTFSPSKNNYREYLQVELSRTLASGEMVCIEVDISPADKAEFVTDGFGIYLSKQKVKHGRQHAFAFDAQFENPELHILDETDRWTLLSDVFEAEGGEKYITLGNFKRDRENTVLRRTKEQGAEDGNGWAYLYIDNVVVKPVKSRDECSCMNDYIREHIHDPPLELSEVREIEMRRIHFDFDKSVLDEVAQSELKDVLSVMRRDRSFFIEIQGHTDIIGAESYNLSLSKARAQTVINFLVNKGVDEDRLQISYLGEENPRASNETDEGRAENRRVEFRILQHKFELYE